MAKSEFTLEGSILLESPTIGKIRLWDFYY